MSEQRGVRALGVLSAVIGIAYFLFEILSSPAISDAAKYFALTMVVLATFAVYVQTYFRRS